MVFANSTCFGDDLMKKLAKGAAALKEGAIVVTMTDPVPSPAFEVLEEVGSRIVGPRLRMTFFCARRASCTQCKKNDDKMFSRNAKVMTSGMSRCLFSFGVRHAGIYGSNAPLERQVRNSCVKSWV